MDTQIHFQIDYKLLQSLFDTSNLQSGQSTDIFEQLGGVVGVCTKLETDVKNGISSLEEREAKFGSNQLKPPALSPFYMCMYKQTKDFCIRILAVATIIMFTMAFFSEEPFEQVVQAISILVAICAVVLIGAMTDYRKEKQFIQLFLEQEQQQRKIFQVTRGGQIRELDHYLLVVGDIITVKPGDNLTVDGVLLEGTENIEVDESMITGLTDTLSKQPISKGPNCFVRGGSNIFEGTAKLLVLVVGESTYSNRMKNDQKDEGEEEEIIHDERSPLSKALETLAKFLVFIGCMSALTMFIILQLYMVRELEELQQKVFSQFALKKILSDFIDAFLIIVLSIPEGLPLIVTLSLAFSIAKLKQQNVVIRNLHVCQVLGGIDTICFDKTGTLTFNNQKVCIARLAGEETNLRAKDPVFRMVAEAILATNAAIPNYEQGQSEISIQQNENNQTSEKSQKSQQSIMTSLQKSIWNGTRLDVALMDYIELKFHNRDFVKQYLDDMKSQSRKTIPMNKNGFSTEVLQIRGDRYRIIIKGKAKEIIEKCSKYNIQLPDNQQYDIYEAGTPSLQNCNNQNLNQDISEIEKKAVLNYNSQSLKTIAFAYKDEQIPNLIEYDWNQLLNDNDFVLIGILAMRDDIRPEAKRLDSALKMGNMNVTILTGDTRINAVNVAKQLGWVSEDKADEELQRTSEHLPKSSELQTNEQAKSDSEGSDNQPKIQSQIIEYPKEELIGLLQKTEEKTIKECLILNFEEYVIRIRKILNESKIFYTHKEVNSKNIMAKIPEIVDDGEAKRKVSQMNIQLQILADLNQHQKHQFLEVYSNTNDSTIGYVGDGNNDAIALQTAAVGITLGKTATNVARECSGIILMNDNLDGIELCMKYGRNIFLNIKRFIYFQLGFFLNSIAVMLTASIFIKQQPYTVLEVIWLSLVQDIFSAIALSTEIPQQDILLRTKPAKRGENIINKFLLQMTCTQAAFQYVATVLVLFLTPWLFNIEPSYNHDLHSIGAEFVPEWAIHYTLVYHLTAMFQIINLVCSRRIGENEYNVLENVKQNKPFTIMILGLLVVQQVIIYAGGKYFKTAPLTLLQNSFCIIISFGSLLVFWLSKYLFSSHK